MIGNEIVDEKFIHGVCCKQKQTLGFSGKYYLLTFYRNLYDHVLLNRCLLRYATDVMHVLTSLVCSNEYLPIANAVPFCSAILLLDFCKS